MFRYLFVLIFCLCSLISKETVFLFSKEHDRAKKIAIVSVLINKSYQDKMAFCTQTKIDYCKKHGYDLILGFDPIYSFLGITTKCKKHPSWHKISWVGKYLPDYDWVFHLDADTMIMNDTIELEDIIDERYDFIICSHATDKEKKSRKNQTVNAGIWFAKNCPGTADFLRTVWELGEDTPLCMRVPLEQIFVQTVLGRPRKYFETPFKWKKCPANVFNTHPRQYEHGNFIVHFYALQGKEEAKALDAWKDIWFYKSGKCLIESPDEYLGE